jgi:heme-degrading monooxygenase HmoA
MIARRWRGRAPGSEQADAYVEHFESAVRPRLASTDGFLGATLERIQHGRDVEIVVVTRWSSMDCIRAFAGDDVEHAVVEPEARAVLSEFDHRVEHTELPVGD